tara:strand:+ start:141 stop:530 length:390 start_codon:yes stop_codon:yes gene_type:complete
MTDIKKTIKKTLGAFKKAKDSLMVIADLPDTEFNFNYKISKLLNVVEAMVKPYEDSFNKFIAKYGTLNETKDKYDMDTTAEGYLADVESIADALKETHSISVDQIPKDDFTRYKIKANHLRHILWLIKY